MPDYKAHRQSFLLALQFLTRIPVKVEYSPDALNQAARYFPAVGLLIGLLSAAITVALSPLFGHALAVASGMLASILITGAFHEDGLADSCDALFGGWQKADVLRIMKDSRLGTFGVTALIAALSIKWLALSQLPLYQTALALICGHALSRALAISYLYDMHYVQDEATSKSKPLARELPLKSLYFALAWGLIPLLLLWPIAITLCSLALLLFIRFAVKHYLKRRLDGYTGDTLGASQQLFEIGFYLCVVACGNLMT